MEKPATYAQKNPPDDAHKAAVAIAEKLRGHNISPDDPAFLVLQATELAARMLEKLPQALDEQVQNRKAEIDNIIAAAIASSARKTISDLSAAKDSLIEEISKSSQKIIKSASKTAFDSVEKSIAGSKLSSFCAGLAAAGIISSFSFIFGRVTARYDFSGGSGLYGTAQTLLSEPIFVIVIVIFIAAIIFKIWK